ncbi:MAG: 2OG-Fe(II) oxygenase, partial [Myxococcota bacterium]
IDKLGMPHVVDELAAMVGLAPFGAMNHESLGVDYSMRFSPLQALFHVLTSDQRLRATLATLCGVDQQTFSRFSGRIYRMVPSRDADVWHNDVHATDRRIIALSLYLESPAPRGGKLLMRRAGLRRPFAQDPPKPRGTLTVFRISHDLEHKVGRVWRGARTNFAGWYLSAPDFDYRGKWLDRPWVGGPGNSLPWLHRQFARR